MTEKKIKLYKKLTESPTNAKFNEICRLAEEVGFEFRNQNGSHKIYKHPVYKKMMNFQPDKRDNSKAKKYQVSQLISFIDDNNLIKEDE